jgi:hypothetical protein
MTDTTVEFPEDRVYNECKAIITLDHQGHIAVTYIDRTTGNDIVMVYLGKEEIEKIAKLYLDNFELVQNEGEKPDDVQNPVTAAISAIVNPTTPTTTP